MKDSMTQAEINRYCNLIASIANYALSQTEGVSKEIGVVKNRFGLSASKNKNVHVFIDDDMATIDITVNVAYGYRVPEVVFNVQQNIKKAVESASSFKIKSINVHVSNVIFK